MLTKQNYRCTGCGAKVEPGKQLTGASYAITLSGLRMKKKPEHQEKLGYIISAQFCFSGYMKRYRYCEYLGKYFCPRCHSNQHTTIPGRILRKWDFTNYSVSNFSHDFLRRIYGDPLFNIEDINSGLYRKVRALDQMRECREELRHLQVFLRTCRNGAR